MQEGCYYSVDWTGLFFVYLRILWLDLLSFTSEWLFGSLQPTIKHWYGSEVYKNCL